MESRRTPTPEAVRGQLERILASSPFTNANRSQRFLRYVVEASLRREEEPPKEYVIAVDVFERDASYDPTVDATVRVEAGRLRSRLRDYYADAGRSDRIVVDVPRGSYLATFHERPTAGEQATIQVTSLGTPAPNEQGVPAKAARLLARPILWAGLTALVLVCVGGTIALLRSRRSESIQAAKGSIVVAVLPFSNKTGIADNNYLTDGLTDNLIRQFSELPGLRVVSRNAIDRVTRQTAGSEFGAGVLLTGELRRNTDGRLVLNSELSNAKDGTVLRSSQYLPDEADLRPVQADIVQDVIQGLGLELDERQSAGALRPLTASPAAFQSFLRGESAIRSSDTTVNLHAAIRDFEEAVRLDPSFALAYAAMAEAHLELALFFEPPLEHMPKAKQSAERALALDPSIQQAHATAGLVDLLYDWDLAGAQKELAATDTRVHAIWQLGCTAHLLGTNGRFRHAEEDLQEMLEFDPRSATLVAEMGCVKYYAGNYDESIRYYRQAIGLNPQSVLAYWGLGRALAREGKYDEALDTLKRFKTVNGSEPPVITAEIGYTEAASGDRSAAFEAIHALQKEAEHGYVDPYFVAIIYLALKDERDMYGWLDKAYSERSSFMISIATDPKWSATRDKPRFQALWSRMMRREYAASTRLANLSTH
jgi:TolB-like protein/Tfp pilus assembly protein PilF